MSELEKKRSEMELDTKRRRSELLAQTRAQYSDTYAPPAIHPRYGNVYHSLYRNDEEAKSEGRIGSFGVRAIIAVVLFALYALASYQGMGEAEAVFNGIQADYVETFDIESIFSLEK